MADIKNMQDYQEHRDITNHLKIIVEHVQSTFALAALVSHQLGDDNYDLRGVGQSVRHMKENLKASCSSLNEIKLFNDVRQTPESKKLHAIACGVVDLIGKTAGDSEKTLMKVVREELVGEPDPNAPVKPQMTDWERRQTDAMG
jgi:hypothetical protein